MWNNYCIFAVDSVVWDRNEPPPMEESTLKREYLRNGKSIAGSRGLLVSS